MFDNIRGSLRGRKPNFKGIPPVRTNETIRCYNSNQGGHMAHKCPAKTISSTHGERRVRLAQESDSQNDSDTYGYPKRGEALMMRRTLLKMPVKEEPP